MSLQVEVVTPAGKVADGEFAEVVLPAWDGESGLLTRHQDYIGSLGTGALKLVKENEDHWLLVSGGVYRVEGGKLTLLPQLAETVDDIDIEATSARQEELQQQMLKASAVDESFVKLRKELELCKARATVYKRARQVN